MMKVEKKRADILLVEKGLVESRQKAQALIMDKKAIAGDKLIEKPGQLLAEDVPLRVKDKEHSWVSRGGMKLEGAVKEFQLDVKDKIAVDIGASTGGFTDVLLHYGAQKVYAIDVGHSQLAWKIRDDDRVVVHEKCNARHLTTEHVPEEFQILVCDASFISLKKVLANAMEMAPIGCQMIALIKPQFEADRDQIGKKGVVKDPAVHEAICEDIKAWVIASGWVFKGLKPSPIKGPEGNIEFLIWAIKVGDQND
jgi:23S rRNA (cytidine1920-2'-O)/16S rRNA (cytidine1409-2'-O)-methyltransferase